MTPTGQAKLIEHEGEKLQVYQDNLGFWTIGVGQCVDSRVPGAGISRRISRLMLTEKIDECTEAAYTTFDWFRTLDTVRQDVIIELIFNIGLGGLKGFKNMLAAIEQKDWQKASFELFNSQWRVQVGPNRSKDLCEALEHGEWESEGIV